MNNLIAVTIGDPKGIGLEILIKLFINKKISNFVLFTNKTLIKKYLRDKKYHLNINEINDQTFKADSKYLNIYSYNSKSYSENTLKSIYFAHNECIKNNYLGMITLPIRKDIIIKNYQSDFIGHTEYLQKLENKKTSNMFLIYNNLIFSTITTHVKINNISKYIRKKNFIYDKLISLDNTLKRDFNYKNAKIIVSGLNPHSGENGTIGREELDFIIPTLKRLKNKNIKIYGPISGDAILINNNLNIYDCFVFMFHDQALIPFKHISNFNGINFTGNLDVIRVSPDHGTAYNLVGKNKANYNSIINCFKIIKKIYKNRINYDYSKKIIRPKLSNR